MRIKSIEKLLEKGADVNISPKKGTLYFMANPALITTVQRRNNLIVQLLLNHGADMDIVDGTKLTALLNECRVP